MTIYKHICQIYAIIPLAAFLLLGCDKRNNDAFDRQTKPLASNDTLLSCEKLMHIQFPKNVKVINAAQIKESQETYVLLLLELPSEELHDLLAHSPFTGAEMRSDRKYVTLESDLQWWSARQVQNYRSSQVLLTNGEYLNILIDKTKTNILYVFLEWGQT